MLQDFTLKNVYLQIFKVNLRTVNVLVEFARYFLP